jgi:peroxiredoxin
MEIFLLALRIVLSAVFGVAAIAKFADMNSSRRTLVNFGVPARLAVPGGYALSLAELATAVGLIPTATAWWGAVAAGALLAVFIVAISVNLARGRAPDCNCFGQIHSRPVSRSLVVRDLLLLAAAIAVVVQGPGNVGLSATAWMADLKTSEAVTIMLGFASAGLLLVAIAYLRRMSASQRSLLDRVAEIERLIDESLASAASIEHEAASLPMEGLPAGAPAPGFTLPRLDGVEVSLKDLLDKGKYVLLVFVSPSCGPCKSLMPLIAHWERDYDDVLNIVALSKGSLKENQKRMGKYGLKNLLLEGEAKVAEAYQATWTPSAVLINREGNIASLLALGETAIQELVKDMTSEVRAGEGQRRFAPVTLGFTSLMVGERAPSFSLEDAAGTQVSLDDLLGEPLLLVFWDSQCPFCRGMADDLRAWEKSRPPEAPRIVFIVTRNFESTHEDFESLILMDYDWEASDLFGTRKTPSAVLIDAEGRVASSLATGKQNVMLLAGAATRDLSTAQVN